MCLNSNENIMIVRLERNHQSNFSGFVEAIKNKVKNSIGKVIVVHSDLSIDRETIDMLACIAYNYNRLIIVARHPCSNDHVEALVDITQNNSLIALNTDDLRLMSEKGTKFSRLGPHNLNSGLEQLDYSESKYTIAIIRAHKGFTFQSFKDIKCKLDAERSPLASLTLGFVEGHTQEPYELDLFTTSMDKPTNMGVIELDVMSIDTPSDSLQNKEKKEECYLTIPQWLRREI
ncbi:hypothetical protein BCU90_11085 [Vibrio lentus]|nr:hypothetical protein BCU90_11085 [Vibrio lentus]